MVIYSKAKLSMFSLSFQQGNMYLFREKNLLSLAKNNVQTVQGSFHPICFLNVSTISLAFTNCLEYFKLTSNVKTYLLLGKNYQMIRVLLSKHALES